LTFKILKNDLSTVLHRSVVRSAADTTHRKKRVIFNCDIQETSERLNTMPDAAMPDKNQPRQMSRKPSAGVSHRTKIQNRQH
jgi:hypothetical protein